MATIWLISDTHFDHANMLGFVGDDGLRIRREFPINGIYQFNQALVTNWNRVVRPSDHVWHLGDVGMSKQSLQWVRQLNGHKRLVFGNHDIFDYKDYIKVGFKKFHAMRVMANVVLTHAPIHPASLGRYVGNAHGHIHRQPSPAGPYFNCSVEANNYTPVTLETVIAHLKLLRAEAV